MHPMSITSFSNKREGGDVIAHKKTVMIKITAYTSHGLLKESSGVHFLPLTHGYRSTFCNKNLYNQNQLKKKRYLCYIYNNTVYHILQRTNSLALSEVLNGPCRIGAHGEEAYEWCLRIALFPSGLEVQDHALSIPFTHGICDVLTSLMQRPVRTP